MDFRNASIPLDKITSFDVNKSIQRSLTKAVARHGVGLYIYAGEDLPEEAKQKVREAEEQNAGVAAIIAKIDVVAKDLPGKGVAKAKIGETIKSICGTSNYKKIQDTNMANSVLEALKNLGVNEG